MRPDINPNRSSLWNLEQGSLKSSVANCLDDVDTSTELRLFFAFQRRHLAFEMMHMLSWEACE